MKRRIVQIIQIALILTALALVLALVAILRPHSQKRSPPPLPPGGISAIQISPPTHRELEEALAFLQPGADCFTLEDAHQRIRERLDQLEAFLCHPPRDESGLAARWKRIGDVIAGDAKASRLVPPSEKIIHRGGGIAAFAAQGMGDPDPKAADGAGAGERRGPLAISGEVLRLIQPLEALDSASIEAVRIEGQPEGALETDVLYQLAGSLEDGSRRVWTGRWAVSWAAEGPITEIRGVEATRAVLDRPPFEDRSLFALGGNPSYEAQLRPGLDFFRERIDGASGIDVSGFEGIAVGDADGDGLEDLYLPEPPGLPNLLFRSRGDGTFEDISRASGADLLDGTSQALFLDLDSDGDEDLFLVCPGQVMVLANDGHAHFEPRPTGLNALAGRGSPRLLTAAAADYDRDGAIDVFVGSSLLWTRPSTGPRPPLPYLDARDGGRGFLLRNQGNGTFRDVTREAGLGEETDRSTTAASWGDLDGDGFPDLCAVGPHGPLRLFHNQGNGTFLETAARAGAADFGGAASLALMDQNDDGRLDILLGGGGSAAGLRIASTPEFRPEDPRRASWLDLARGNALLWNRGDGRLADASNSAEPQWAGFSFSSDFLDFDLDGREDIYIARGFVTGDLEDLAGYHWRQVIHPSPDRPIPRARYGLAWEALQRAIHAGSSLGGRERNRLLLGGEDGTFVDVSPASGADSTGDGRAFAVLDSDGDGLPDIILRSRRGPRLRVLANRLGGENRSVWFHLTGSGGNRDALGARIEIATDRGSRMKEVSAGSGFLSQRSRWISFGLGKGGEVRGARIRWPGGQVQELTGVSPGMRYRVIEGKAPAGEPLAHPAPRADSPPGSAVPAAPEPPQASPLAHVWLLEPFPPPALKFRDLSGRPDGLKESKKRKVLLFLAPDCGASVKEADEIGAGIGSIEAAGGEVAAVVVARSNHEEEARERFGDLPFPVYLADRKSLRVWNAFHRSLFNRPRDLAVPTVFLIDGQKGVEKVYRGLVATQEIVQDLRRFPIREADRFSLALPFQGKLLGPPFRRDPLGLGALLVEAGPSVFTERVLEAELRDGSHRAEAFQDIGRALEDTGERDEAEKIYREALSNEPGRPEVSEELAHLLISAGKFPAAREVCLRALKAGVAEAALPLGETYLRDGKPADAARIFREALRTDPESIALWCSLAFSLYKDGKSSEAVEAFGKAIRISPTDPEAVDGLANLLLERGSSGDLDRARDILEKAIARHPMDMRLLNEVGRVRLIFEDFDGAEAAYRTAIAANRESDVAYLNLARLKLKQKDPDSAEETLRDLLLIQPANPRAREMLAGIGK